MNTVLRTRISYTKVIMATKANYLVCFKGNMFIVVTSTPSLACRPEHPRSELL